MSKTPPANSTILNICIIPPQSVSAEYVAISQSLKSPGTMFVLDGENAFPHGTIYMVRVADNDISDFVDKVKWTLQEQHRFSCIHTGYFMTEGRYLEASYRRTTELMHLHERLIANLKGYRLNPNHPFVESYFTPYTVGQRENAEATGYDLANNLYRPHVTLTRYKEGGLPGMFPGIARADLSFLLDTICVYKADENGAVYEKLATFPIGQ